MGKIKEGKEKRNIKKVAGRSLKEKRADKAARKAGKNISGIDS